SPLLLPRGHDGQRCSEAEPRWRRPLLRLVRSERMSRIGRMPIPLPPGVEVAQEGNRLTVKGPLGTLERELHPEMKLEREDGELRIVRPSDEPRHRALHGLTRTLVNNMVTGVTSGFTKNLEISG